MPVRLAQPHVAFPNYHATTRRRIKGGASFFPGIVAEPRRSGLYNIEFARVLRVALEIVRRLLSPTVCVDRISVAPANTTLSSESATPAIGYEQAVSGAANRACWEREGFLHCFSNALPLTWRMRINRKAAHVKAASDPDLVLNRLPYAAPLFHALGARINRC